MNASRYQTVPARNTDRLLYNFSCFGARNYRAYKLQPYKVVGSCTVLMELVEQRGIRLNGRLEFLAELQPVSRGNFRWNSRGV